MAVAWADRLAVLSQEDRLDACCLAGLAGLAGTPALVWPQPPVVCRYWDVRFGAVRGTVQLYLNSTSREDALSGDRACTPSHRRRAACLHASGWVFTRSPLPECAPRHTTALCPAWMPGLGSGSPAGCPASGGGSPRSQACLAPWAVAGERATMMELSMRLARHDACDACRPRRLDAALQLIVQLCKELGRHGWQARPAASTEMRAEAGAASGRLEGQLGWQ